MTGLQFITMIYLNFIRIVHHISHCMHRDSQKVILFCTSFRVIFSSFFHVTFSVSMHYAPKRANSRTHTAMMVSL